MSVKTAADPLPRIHGFKAWIKKYELDWRIVKAIALCRGIRLQMVAGRLVIEGDQAARLDDAVDSYRKADEALASGE